MQSGVSDHFSTAHRKGALSSNFTEAHPIELKHLEVIVARAFEHNRPPAFRASLKHVVELSKAHLIIALADAEVPRIQVETELLDGRTTRCTAGQPSHLRQQESSRGRANAYGAGQVRVKAYQTQGQQCHTRIGLAQRGCTQPERRQSTISEAPPGLQARAPARHLPEAAPSAAHF